MSSWRDQILKEFTPKVARLTLVADPDGLLLEEGILEGVRKRGFELIPFEDHIAFRYAYESKFRSRWDRGEHTDLVVVLRSQASDLGGLPYDLLQAGRRLSFNLGDIFPNLSYPVVTALDRGDLDAQPPPTEAGRHSWRVGYGKDVCWGAHRRRGPRLDGIPVLAARMGVRGRCSRCVAHYRHRCTGSVRRIPYPREHDRGGEEEPPV